jgi:hypothetical protein
MPSAQLVYCALVTRALSPSGWQWLHCCSHLGQQNLPNNSICPGVIRLRIME